MKVNENGTLLKVKCLILLNIFSVFPTHVGMFLNSYLFCAKKKSLPHACGAVPNLHNIKEKSYASSPRMWGCSLRCSPVSICPTVFPTHVGMFHCRMIECHLCYVFPPHVGMFPTWLENTPASLPHACGAVPVPVPVHACNWRVLPTHVGFSKRKNFSFCLHLESACYISAFIEPILVGSLSNHLCVCAVRVPVFWTGYGSVEDTRHISALFVNLTFHLRRNHHVRRICSRP